jgi:serine/threonine protein kinase
MQRLLEFNPTKRITAEEALRHPYISKFYQPEDTPVCPRIIHIPISDDRRCARGARVSHRRLLYDAGGVLLWRCCQSRDGRNGVRRRRQSVAEYRNTLYAAIVGHKKVRDPKFNRSVFPQQSIRICVAVWVVWGGTLTKRRFHPLRSFDKKTRSKGTTMPAIIPVTRKWLRRR